MKRVVGWSGGIDSQATALWVRERFPAEDIILLRSDAGGNEHPLTEEFTERYSREVFPVVTVQAIVADLGDVGSRCAATRERRERYLPNDRLTFDILAEIKGIFPRRKAQFCTEYLKLAPSLRWLRENLTGRGIDYARYVGVRRDESQTRASCPDSKWDHYFGCTVYYPIAEWTKEQCFASILRAGEPINPLYRMGFGRVGCAPCINSGKEDVRLWAAQAPEMIAKIRAWEERLDMAFFAPCVPGKDHNTIDEVVAWSKTTRGGKQLALPILEAEAERGACMSRYGLCE